MGFGLAALMRLAFQIQILTLFWWAPCYRTSATVQRFSWAAASLAEPFFLEPSAGCEAGAALSNAGRAFWQQLALGLRVSGVVI